MSKKKKEEETIIEEGTEKKKVSKKEKKEDETVLKTLYELVTSSPTNTLTLISQLSNDYLTQFYEEENKFYKNEYVEPTLSEEEFKKIIGG